MISINYFLKLVYLSLFSAESKSLLALLKNKHKYIKKNTKNAETQIHKNN